MIDWLGTVLTESPRPDLLRLVAVPVFAWAAYRDIRTRRVPNATWLPLALLGIALLAWDISRVSAGDLPGGLVARERFYLRVALSLGMVGSIGYLFYYLGGFGGADAKALIVLAVLFPTFPTYIFPAEALPLTRTTVGVFSLTVLSNTVLVGAAYPLAVTLRNAVTGHLAPIMFIGKPIRAGDAISEYGSLLQTPEGFTRGGLDLDALRMYLRWRGTTLAAVRDDPEHHRDPASLPDDPRPPGDGSIPDSGGVAAGTDGETATDGGKRASADDTDGDGVSNRDGGSNYDDPWGAQAFLDDIEGSAYGTTADGLADGLDVLAEEDVVWISPGMPFIVPMFVALVISLVYGDLFFQLVSILV
ncbi:Peptidase A24B, FlaK domain protein [Halosimplex carlsbadense 2-9-1]|uniref:Peptidase A24B, FlaK domain protein n=1 Tax=Halosimplex carlsbadense 2-9-1 TaxID=797114 RepID=M0D3S5_9EURY|nr:A24 family peptidase [Halosimplex carlsbadense]ELZ28814.1 Peptidase A24B, FlaK domain protein [Halosimplex carlsbadense 2-9-1]